MSLNYTRWAESSQSNARFAAYRGFTLLEIGIAIVIIGIGVTAAVNLLGTSTDQNMFAAKRSVGMLLANDVQELISTVQYRDPRYINDDTHWALNPGEVLGPGNTNLGLEYLDGAIWGYDASPRGTPIDATWNVLAANVSDNGILPITSYSQKITVTKVNRTDLRTALASTAPDQGVRRVTIQVYCKPSASAPDELIYETALLRFADR